MEIRIFQDLWKALPKQTRIKYDVNTDDGEWPDYKSYMTLDIMEMDKKELKTLLEKIEPFAAGAKKLEGAPAACVYIRTWMEVLDNGAKDIRANTVEKFCSFLHAYLSRVEGHRLYEHDPDRGVNFCYYVGKIRYNPKQIHESSTTPAHVQMTVYYREFGKIESDMKVFWPENCVGKTPYEALSWMGLVAENTESRKKYLEERKRYEAESGQVGKQFFARGIATNDLDGNTDREDRWYWSSTKTIRLDKNGEPSNVVVDVYKETDKEERERDEHVDAWFWKRRPKWAGKKDKDDDGDDDYEADIEEVAKDLGEYSMPEIPVHPTVPCFDLRRHMRLRVHISQLEEYLYDPKLGDKLILPKEHRALVETLLNHKSGFKDIIKGKSGGAIVLCAGPPGTGKTLTSEVYAEVSARPLYTVQCSQLGTNPDGLEDELLKVFTRSQRWNAILLLDEADVYVAARGNNLVQNAIVGVFLRTLEYYKGVMFLTTNRADLIDDAIASRCIAKIGYEVPPVEDQRRIWEILVETAGAFMPKAELEKVLKDHPHLSGRDIKNLVKLVMMVNGDDKKQITAEAIKFVKKFKPTEDSHKEVVR